MKSLDSLYLQIYILHLPQFYRFLKISEPQVKQCSVHTLEFNVLILNSIMEVLIARRDNDPCSFGH